LSLKLKAKGLKLDFLSVKQKAEGLKLLCFIIFIELSAFYFKLSAFCF
jgi:hypothetical protein